MIHYSTGIIFTDHNLTKPRSSHLAQQALIGKSLEHQKKRCQNQHARVIS